MQHPCNRLFPNIKQPVPHLVTVMPTRSLLQSRYSVHPLVQPHLWGAQAVVAGSNFTSIHCSLDTEQRCSKVEKFYEVEMAVRDCDIDKYGVVDNAVYADYVSKGREEFVRIHGINTDSIAETGNAFAISELHLNYFAPLRGGSKFVVKTRLIKIKGVRMFFEQFIETLPVRNVILKATATVVCLNKDYRPIRVFPDTANKLLGYQEPV